MRSTPTFTRNAGFSLIELLCVIAVIATLTAILIPAVSVVSRRADDTKCRGSLHHWGVAMQLYALDHEGRLPGPSYANILPTALAENNRHLFAYLAPYMGLINSRDSTLPLEYYCPGWLREAEGTTGPVYYLYNRAISLGDEAQTTVFPFGQTTGNVPGMKLAYLQTLVDSSKTIAMMDIDGAMMSSGAKASYGDQVPQEPVHGEHRNVLFLDWSVGTKPVSQ